jgi:molybdopterin converting factor small subunit
MKVRVLLFGPAAMASGADSVTVSVEEGASRDRVLAALSDQFPSLRPFARVGRLAVNAGYSDAQTRIAANDELALISMVSGG